jgi:hypothetical protein
MALKVACGRSKELRASEPADQGSFEMEIEVPSERKNLGEKHRQHGCRNPQDMPCFSRVTSVTNSSPENR